VPANSRLVASSYVSLTSGTGLLRRGYLPAWTRVITVELDGRRLQTMTATAPSGQRSCARWWESWTRSSPRSRRP